MRPSPGRTNRDRPPAPPARRSPPAGFPSATSLPLCSTMMRSASERTTSILCSTSRMILARVLLELRDQIEHDRHLVDAHSGGRLVEHEDLRLERDHQRDLELALVAMRQRRPQRCRADVVSAHALEHRVARARSGRRASSTAAACRSARRHARLHGEAHVLEPPTGSETDCVSWNARPSPASRARGRRQAA